jgi:hypothetical protein
VIAGLLSMLLRPSGLEAMMVDEVNAYNFYTAMPKGAEG